VVLKPKVENLLKLIDELNSALLIDESEKEDSQAAASSQPSSEEEQKSLQERETKSDSGQKSRPQSRGT